MKRRKNKKAETFTVTAKRFMISCILILSMTGLAAGISYAGGNSRHMAMGESGSTVALAHNEKKLELNINEKNGSDIQSVPAGKVQGLFIFSARSAERYFLAHRAHTLTASFSASALSGVTKAVLYT